MMQGVYLPNFFKKCLLALPSIPKKILGSLGPPPLWGPEPPQAPFGGSGAPQRGWAHRPQIFFGNSRECQQTFFKEIGQIYPLHHGFFQLERSEKNRLLINILVKLQLQLGNLIYVQNCLIFGLDEFLYINFQILSRNREKSNL